MGGIFARLSDTSRVIKMMIVRVLVLLMDRALLFHPH